MSARRPRLLVFILTYEAARHIRGVVDRIPRDLGDEFDVQVLLIDDGSTDGTAAVARESLRAAALPYAVDAARQSGEPGLRRQPEARLPVCGRPRIRRGRHAPRRRAVPAGGGPSARPPGARPRRRVRKPVRDAWRCQSGRDARVQVRRQSGADPRPEPVLGTEPDRVPLRVPGLSNRRAGADPLRPELRRLPLRHRDLHPVHPRRCRDRRDADPHPLRRRGVPSPRRQVRDQRDRPDGAGGPPRQGPLLRDGSTTSAAGAACTRASSASRARRAPPSSASRPAPWSSTSGAPTDTSPRRCAAKECRVIGVDLARAGGTGQLRRRSSSGTSTDGLPPVGRRDRRRPAGRRHRAPAVAGRRSPKPSRGSASSTTSAMSWCQPATSPSRYSG